MSTPNVTLTDVSATYIAIMCIICTHLCLKN